MRFPKNQKANGNFEDRTADGPYSMGKLLGSIQAALGWYAGGEKIDDSPWVSKPQAPSRKGDWPTNDGTMIDMQSPLSDAALKQKRARDSEFYRKLEEEIGVRPR